MHKSKLVGKSLRHHTKFWAAQAPNTEEERKKIRTILYANGDGSIMYGIICSRPDMAHAVNVVSTHMVDPGQTH